VCIATLEPNYCRISTYEYVYLTFLRVRYHYIITYCYGLALASIRCAVILRCIGVILNDNVPVHRYAIFNASIVGG
jgi:hypothetical protein